MGIAEQLKDKYGVTVADDSYYNPYTGRMVKQYKMYSADGCQWENGLRTLIAVKQECEEWADALKSIKRCVDARKAVLR